LAGTPRRVRVLPGRKIGCAKARNRRVERHLREHRKKHQSKVQTSKILLTYLLFLLHPLSFRGNSSFILLPSSFIKTYPLSLILHPLNFACQRRAISLEYAANFNCRQLLIWATADQAQWVSHLSLILLPLSLIGGGSYRRREEADHKQRVSTLSFRFGGSVILYPFAFILKKDPFALILFKSETRARLFAFFQLLIIHPCLNAPE
jgi:hypothetical protein